MTHTEEASPRRTSVNASNQPSSFVPEARVESIEEAPSSSQHGKPFWFLLLSRNKELTTYLA